ALAALEGFLAAVVTGDPRGQIAPALGTLSLHRFRDARRVVNHRSSPFEKRRRRFSARVECRASGAPPERFRAPCARLHGTRTHVEPRAALTGAWAAPSARSAGAAGPRATW